MEQHYKVQREYKDTIFRMLFRDKRELLALYNGLNETAYTDPEQLEVYTLDNAIYMNMKNDVSILLDSVLTLYEQQATVNPNMPLREYSLYVDRVRTHAKKLPIEEAVQRSVNECIEEGILSEFLKLQKSEVIRMSIFEYNEETELKKIREDEYDLGLEAGKRIGLEEGERIGLEAGERIGLEHGREIGIKALVETCRELEMPEAEVISRVSAKFSIPLKAAEEYVKKL